MFVTIFLFKFICPTFLKAPDKPNGFFDLLKTHAKI